MSRTNRPPRQNMPLACLAVIAALLIAPATLRADDDALQAYLERLDLNGLLAQQLEDRLERATGTDRIKIAEQLAAVYVDLLRSTDDARNADYQDRARELLTRVPEADSTELRLDLARAVYAVAEDALERHRLRLAEPAELSDARVSLTQLQRQFVSIASDSHRRVGSLESREDRGDDSEETIHALSEARRLRSLAFYYAGWAEYYIAYATDTDRTASDAMKHFGWLLNSSGGSLPAIDQVSIPLLKYEHIARAAIGCALCAAQRGRDAEAERWLNLVDEAPDATDEIRQQVFLRRISILASATRWSDLEILIRRARRPAVTPRARRDAAPTPTPLPTSAARLLAVLTLEADRTRAPRPIEQLAGISFADLVAQRETGHVLDLVERYGTEALDENGFIAHYVRGVRAYDNARTEHTLLSDPDEPTQSRQAIDDYNVAAGYFQAALEQQDVEQFAKERASTAMLLGFCNLYAGKERHAATWFLSSSELANDPADAEEAMWLAIVAFDRAGAKHEPLLGRRDQIATLYLQTYPDSERAATLLLRDGTSGLAQADNAVKILLAVEPASAVYPNARRRAASLLYRIFRNTNAAEKDFAALRFAAVAEEVLAWERQDAQGTDEPAIAAAERAVVYTRQLLDALLSVSNPDAERAERVLDALRTIARRARLELDDIESELLFRQLQLALARDDLNAADPITERLERFDDPYADAAARLLFTRARNRLAREPDNLDAARAVMANAERVLDGIALARGRPADSTLMEDPIAYSVASSSAAAGSTLWDQARDSDARDHAIRLDKRILDERPADAAALRRLARLADAAGQPTTALDAWRRLLVGTPRDTLPWFEARYHSARLLLAIDPSRAATVLQQHRALYPAYGPEPWGSKLKALHEDTQPDGSGGAP